MVTDDLMELDRSLMSFIVIAVARQCHAYTHLSCVLGLVPCSWTMMARVPNSLRATSWHSSTMLDM